MWNIKCNFHKESFPFWKKKKQMLWLLWCTNISKYVLGVCICLKHVFRYLGIKFKYFRSILLENGLSLELRVYYIGDVQFWISIVIQARLLLLLLLLLLFKPDAQSHFSPTATWLERHNKELFQVEYTICMKEIGRVLLGPFLPQNGHFSTNIMFMCILLKPKAWLYCTESFCTIRFFCTGPFVKCWFCAIDSEWKCLLHRTALFQKPKLKKITLTGDNKFGPKFKKIWQLNLATTRF